MSEATKCPKCGETIRMEPVRNASGGEELVGFEVVSGGVHDVVRCLERQLAQAQAKLRTQNIRAADAEAGLRTCRKELEATQGELRAKTEAIRQLEGLLAQARKRIAEVELAFDICDDECTAEGARADKAEAKRLRDFRYTILALADKFGVANNWVPLSGESRQVLKTFADQVREAALAAGEPDAPSKEGG